MLYLIAARELGRGKIGHSTDPQKRLRDLQTSSPTSLELVGVLPGGPAEEAVLHARYAEHRICGEWFTLVPTMMLEFGHGEWSVGQQPLGRKDSSKLACPYCLTASVLVSWGDLTLDTERISFYCDNSDCEARSFDVVIISHEGYDRFDVRLLDDLDDGAAYITDPPRVIPEPGGTRLDLSAEHRRERNRLRLLRRRVGPSAR